MKNKKLIIILVALAIIVITASVSYSFFSYIKDGNTMNSITTGSITFHYKEITGVGAGISIEEALPISDSEGKSQNKYFDFKITSKSNVSQVPYVVTATADGNVELGEIIKVYLTELVGGNEQQLLLDMYNNLTDATFITNRSDKVLYRDVVPMNNSKYEKNFRLRMWMDASVNLATQICSIEPSINTTASLCNSAGGTWKYKYNNKEFSIRVNVYTNDGSSLTEDNITTPDDTRLSMITANNTYLFTESNDTGVDYEVSVPNEVSDVVLNITEKNVLATSTVTELGQTLSYLDSPKVRRITNSNSYSLLKGNNYFKIRVTSQNLEETKDYIIKVTREKDQNNDLSSLSIEGYAFNEPFDKDTTTYTVSLEESSITLIGNKASDVASINANDLGVKQLSWGNNQFTVTVTAENNTQKVYTINVNNVRPTAPHIIGGTNGETVSEDRNITIDSPGTAVSGVAYYEYYKSNTNTPPTNATEGIVLNSPYNLTVSDNGTSYIWYRTVSNKGNKSEWTEEPEEVIIDRTYQLTLTGDSHVSLSPSGTTTIGYGEQKQVVATPSIGYRVTGVTCTNDYTVTGIINSVQERGAQTAVISNNNKKMGSTCTFTTTQNQYTLTLDNDGVTTQKTVTYGGLYGDLPTPEKADYTFQGWYLENTKIESTDTVEITEDSTLVARWTFNGYTIVFHGNGGTGTMDNQLVRLGETTTITANSFSYTGYTFAGWATSSNGAKVYNNSQSITNIGTGGQTINLYAKWEKAPMILYNNGLVEGYNWYVSNTASGASSNLNTGEVYPNNANWHAIQWRLDNVNLTGYHNIHMLVTTGSFQSNKYMRLQYNNARDNQNVLISTNAANQTNLQLNGTLNNLGTVYLVINFGGGGRLYVHRIWVD